MNRIDESYNAFRGVGAVNTNYQQASNADFANVSDKVKSATETDITATMTMEEYKQYLHEKISDISISSTQGNVFYFIDITDEGFEAMKNNQGYENKVLEMIKEYFQRRVPNGYSGATIFSIGTNPEDIFIQSYSSQGMSGRNRDEKSFWERRAEREKEINEQNEKYREKKRLREAYIGKLIQERHFVERKNFEELSRVAAVKTKDPENLNEEVNLITEKVISSYQKFSL